jgi:predicted RNase H-like HicB family nuclease
MPMKPVFEKTSTGYITWVDGLPGALTQGDSLKEARENAADDQGHQSRRALASSTDA